MTETKKKVIFTALGSLMAVCICFCIFGFKISTVFTFNFPIFFFFLMLSVASVIVTFVFYKRKNLKNDAIKPNIFVILIIFSLTAFFCDWATTFTFDKWKNHECLRQFMMDDFHDTQAFEKDNDYFLSKYTRDEAKELLNVGSGKDRIPEITYTFVDDAAENYSADIYFAYKGLNGVDYWLVVNYLGTDPSVQTDTSGIYIYPSGSNIEAGKIIYTYEQD